MPFKTIPKIIYGKGSIDDLRKKEILAHLMLRTDLGAEIDKYKFKINSEYYLYLLYKNLRKMKKPEGWKWKKQTKETKDKYAKLIEEYLPILSKRMFITKHDLIKWEYHKILNNMASDEDIRREMVNLIIEDQGILESKKKDKLMKKYDVKPKQQTLW